MFELTKEEYDALRCQFGTLNISGRGEHSKFLPFVFTEHGVLMLSSVLNSANAISVNIQITRVFSYIRKMLTDNTELRLEIEKIKKKVESQNKNIEVVFRYLDELVEKTEKLKTRKQIGYKQ